MRKEEHTFFGIGSIYEAQAKSLPAIEREERIRDSQGRWNVSADGGGDGGGAKSNNSNYYMYNYCILYALTSPIVFFSYQNFYSLKILIY